MTVLLALDSSTESMALALSSPQGRWFFEGAGGAQASSQMVPELMALLERAGLRLADVDAIGFGCGPGAFTGLRTACAVAQGLAFGAGKPVLALDSLMLVAEDVRQQSAMPFELVWVAMDARMGEIYAAAYAHDGRRWQTAQAPALYSPARLLAHWGGSAPAALCGSAIAVFDELRDVTPAWPSCRSRAQALAVLAEQAWGDGLLLDPAEAMPVYVRDKVAQTTEERLALRAAASAAATAAS
jgi:tRNA threonylcarbamoyladenosine biosynthesis protein TsaB